MPPYRQEGRMGIAGVPREAETIDREFGAAWCVLPVCASRWLSRAVFRLTEN